MGQNELQTGLSQRGNVTYNRAFQTQLADEIQRLPPGAALEQAMLDYARLRDQARACAARP
jgi:hypothetical protein